MRKATFLAITGASLSVLAGCAGHKYVKVAQAVPTGKTQGFSEAEKAADSLLGAITSNPAAVRHFQNMFKTAVLEVVDFDSLTFTVKIIDSTAVYAVGTEAGLRPDLVLPLRVQNLQNLAGIFADGAVSDEEGYRIHRAVFGSSLQNLFQVDALYDPRVARKLDLPNLIHMTLKNDGNYEFMGSTREATVTIANVDGQWLVFQGAQGDPGVKYRVGHRQLAEFQKLVFAPGGAASPGEPARKKLEEVKKFLDGVTVYRRGQG